MVAQYYPASRYDPYLQCLAEDPRYAPAWARLGRVYRRLGESGDFTAMDEFLQKAEEAFTRALDINPELSLAHNLYAYLQVDLGRAQEAMLHLLERVQEHRADPDLFAGLVHACRYCGLLDASVAAYEKASRLDPNIRTSVCQTFWMMGDIRRAIETEPDDDPMMTLLSSLRQGRNAEVIVELRRRQQDARGSEPASIALIAALEGNREEFVGPFDACKLRIRDPENLYYWALMAAYVGDADRALETLQRVVDGGWFCYATMAREPWLDGLRDDDQFVKLVREAEVHHDEAAEAFKAAGGGRLLGVRAAGS